MFLGTALVAAAGVPVIVTFDAALAPAAFPATTCHGENWGTLARASKWILLYEDPILQLLFSKMRLCTADLRACCPHFECVGANFLMTDCPKSEAHHKKQQVACEVIPELTYL